MTSEYMMQLSRRGKTKNVSVSCKDFYQAVHFFARPYDKRKDIKVIRITLRNSQTEMDKENNLIKQLGDCLGTDDLITNVQLRKGYINQELSSTLEKAMLNINILELFLNSVTCNDKNALAIMKALRERPVGLSVDLNSVEDNLLIPFVMALSRKKTTGLSLSFCSGRLLKSSAVGRIGFLGEKLTKFALHKVYLDERMIQALGRMIPHLTSCSYFGLNNIDSPSGARARSKAFSFLLLGLLKRKTQPANFRLELKENKLRNMPGILLSRILARNYCVNSVNLSSNKFNKNTMKALFNGFQRNQSCSTLVLRQVKFKNVLLGSATLSIQDSSLAVKKVELSGNFASTYAEGVVPPGSGVRIYTESSRRERR